MGGYGSGRNSGKPKVGECLRLEMPLLKKRGYLGGMGQSGSWYWSRGGEPSGSIRLRTVLDDATTGRLILDYCREGVTKHQVIYLEAASMRFGGVRWWAICPINGNRCGTLVMSLRHDGFVSVKASGYLYGSQTEDDLDRLARKRDKAEARYKGLSKYARKPTKERVFDAYVNLASDWDESFGYYAARLLAKYG